MFYGSVALLNKGKIEELREEVGVKESFRRKLGRRRLKWAGQMEVERLTKRADVFGVEGRRRRRRP